MRIPLRSDYALRAVLVLARAWPDAFVKAEEIAATEGLPLRFLENILADLRRAGLVVARRGHRGGYVLTRQPADIDLVQVLSAVDCPLLGRDAWVGTSPLASIWAGVDASIRREFTTKSLADLATAS